MRPAVASGERPEVALIRTIEAVPDPELPMVTIADLGILRSVQIDGSTVAVSITPTYSGCPAMAAITDRITYACRSAGFTPTITTDLHPAWTSDWITPSGREALAAAGISPPEATSPPSTVSLQLRHRQVRCPLCGSLDTTELSRFGSTACKALRRCEHCREPFDEFKAH